VENPNEYDDHSFAHYSSAVDSAIGGLWEAGASLDNIEEIVRNALENAEAKAHVLITDA